MALGDSTLRKDSADAFCTVVAMGFLALNPKQLDIRFVEDDPTDRNKSLREHDAFRERLKLWGFDRYIGDFQQQDGKTEHPMIYAVPKGEEPGEKQLKPDEHLYRSSHKLEGICNEWVETQNCGRSHKNVLKLRGAYIGGVAEEKQLRLLYPSLIHVRPSPNYINIDNESYKASIRKNYRDSCEVSVAILEFFDYIKNKYKGHIIESVDTKKRKRQGGNDSENGIFIWTTVEDTEALKEKMGKDIEEQKIFGSVHGLVTSMTEAQRLEEGNFNVELALSRGTNKVASCIPCSIFAASQDAPPSYIHFGRGDFWDLPQNCDEAVRKKWEDYVYKCFEKGMFLLGGRIYGKSETNILYRFFRQLGVYDNKIGHEKFIPESDCSSHYISEIFLDALTFEGSFMSKMKNTLSRL